MQWLVAVGVFAAFLITLPWVLRRAKRLGKGGAGAVALALGLAFSSFLDPARKAATETIGKRKERDEPAGEGDTKRT